MSDISIFKCINCCDEIKPSGVAGYHNRNLQLFNCYKCGISLQKNASTYDWALYFKNFAINIDGDVYESNDSREYFCIANTNISFGENYEEAFSFLKKFIENIVFA